MEARLAHKVSEVWPELFAADVERNVGMPMELFSAEVYAEQDGQTPEEYIVRVLRAERERRQAQDRIVSDRAWLDELIDGADEAGIPVLEHVLAQLNGSKWTEGSSRRVEDLAPQFIRTLARRLQERLRAAELIARRVQERES